jgi:hypothetical protein
VTLATTALASARTIEEVRSAAKSSGARVETDADGAECFRFRDQSVIRIQGRKVRVGAWRYIEVDAAPPSRRQCTSPDCWACSGTGIEKDGKLCTWNDAIPF